MDDRINPDKEKVPYFSNILCDCGCENRMPQRLVDLGWKFLKGHKPKGGAISSTKKTLNNGRAPVAKPGLIMDMPHIHSFVRTTILQLIDQHTEAIEAIKVIKQQETELFKRLRPLQTDAQNMYRGLELLYPAVDKDTELRKAIDQLNADAGL